MKLKTEHTITYPLTVVVLDHISQLYITKFDFKCTLKFNK